MYEVQFPFNFIRSKQKLKDENTMKLQHDWGDLYNVHTHVREWYSVSVYPEPFFWHISEHTQNKVAHEEKCRLNKSNFNCAYLFKSLFN